MIPVEKWNIMTPLQKSPKNVGDLGKLIVAKGFEKLPKVKCPPIWSHCYQSCKTFQYTYLTALYLGTFKPYFTTLLLSFYSNKFALEYIELLAIFATTYLPLIVHRNLAFIYFLVKSFLVNFYRHLVIFFWSHWFPFIHAMNAIWHKPYDDVGGATIEGLSVPSFGFQLRLLRTKNDSKYYLKAFSKTLERELTSDVEKDSKL